MLTNNWIIRLTTSTITMIGAALGTSVLCWKVAEYGNPWVAFLLLMFICPMIVMGWYRSVFD